MEIIEPLVFPTMRMPEPTQLPTPILEVPEGAIPSYTPLVVPPSTLKAPPDVNVPMEGEEPATEPASPPKAPFTLPPLPPEVRQVVIPNTDITIPVPQTAILVTAATTATVSVAATLTASAIFKRLVSLMKPIIKKILSKKQPNAEN
jgi:hypothetical protein